MRWSFLLLLSCVARPACSDDVVEPMSSPAPSIITGADGVGADRADSDCAIILRSIARVPNGTGGYVSLAPDGRIVWQGQLDVARAAADDATGVAVLFQTTETNGRWYAAPATRLDTTSSAAVEPRASGEVAHYTFRIDTFTPREGMSTTSLSRTVIRLIPFIAPSTGGRVFDHNRVSDALAAYELTAQNQWSISADGACPATTDDGIARWSFAYPEFRDALVGGPLLAGQRVRIAYDGRRLRETQGCMGAHGPSSSTTLYVSSMIDNDASIIVSQEVERYTIGSGYACSGDTSPCVRQEVFEPVIDLPANARDLAVWFSCVPGFDAAPNVRYDSNDGANYHQAIVAAPGNASGQPGSAGPSDVDWMGAWGLYRARPSDVIALTDPLAWGGFTNMGLAVQAEVWSEGVAASDLQVFIESDALACTPGGAITREPLVAVATNAGPFGHNALYRWAFESLMGRCPAGTYRYRFVASADGGLTFTTLGAGADASADAPDITWRTLISTRP